MRTIRTIAEMRAWLGNARAESRSVGLVPTMGAFHAGHHSLMARPRDEMDEVVGQPVRQPGAVQRRRRPRSTTRAARPTTRSRRASSASTCCSRPPTSEIYPEGFSTTVSVGGLSEVLEGAERGPGHFAGVCTVVCKLLNIIAPDVAYFGQKDAQQVAVVKRMVRDLDMPSKIEVLPTVREPDGLALSSRNVRLSPDGPRARASPCRGAVRRARRRRRRRARRRRASAPPRWPRSATSSPSTSRSSTRSPSPR